MSINDGKTIFVSRFGLDIKLNIDFFGGETVAWYIPASLPM